MKQYTKRRNGIRRKSRKTRKSKKNITRKTKRKKTGGYRYNMGQIVHVQYSMDNGTYQWWRGRVIAIDGNNILVSWGYQTPDGFPAQDWVNPNGFRISPPIRRGGRKKRKSQKRRRKSKKKKRGGNEPNQDWPEDPIAPIDLCKKKYNDVNYRHLTDRQADRYCIKTHNENSKCIDGDCKFIENTRPRNDPSSIYDDDLVRRYDELRDGTFHQREAEYVRERRAGIDLLNQRLANRSVSPDSVTY